MSLTTSRRIGLPGKPASTIPISPPSEVPTQSTCSAPTPARSALMSAQYWGSAYSVGFRSLPLRPRPTRSGHLASPRCG